MIVDGRSAARSRVVNLSVLSARLPGGVAERPLNTPKELSVGPNAKQSFSGWVGVHPVVDRRCPNGADRICGE
jgi:hypothetical protein